MDTKSKNYHKLAVGLMILVILLPSLAMMIIRPHYVKGQNKDYIPELNTSGFMEVLTNSNYVLYAEEKQRRSSEALNPFDVFFPSTLKTNPEKSTSDKETESKSGQDLVMEEVSEEEFQESKYKDIYGDENTGFSSSENIMNASNEMSSVFSNWNSKFSILRSYIKYEVTDESGKVIDSNASEKLSDYLSGLEEDKLDSKYTFGATVTYDNAGNISNARFFSDKSNNATQLLNEAVRYNPCSSFDSRYNINAPFQRPQNRTFTYLMKTSDMKSLVSKSSHYLDYLGFYNYNTNDDLLIVFLTLVGLVTAAGLLLPFIKPLQIGREKIFHIPLEMVVIVGGACLALSAAVAVNNHTMSNEAIYNVMTSVGMNPYIASALQYIWGFMGWVLIFGVFFWAAGCLRSIFVLGPKRYIKERVIIYRIIPWSKRQFRKIYNGLLSVNLKDNTTRILIKIVLINFVILGFISLLWIWGMGALIVYSIVLFLLLRKYCTDLRKQYHRLLDATNQLAEGNLNGTIPEDLGVFEPFREEISKIQAGFKKAVNEEVKSQKMKADLITNVSHDLKTPLTAIISYVDLLKDETITEEERRHYIQVLDQKSSRLKVLIEDLFEVSKATSRNITLNIMNVDIVNLIKQVKLELQDKIDASQLYFRFNLPEEKIILPLDSQKTYRVLENLMVNITKYAMPKTRVYIDLADEEKRVRITLKNISASELNFNASEITDRFVRGDSSRNTEGSGLGLAIAKSFTELQGGTLDISVNADLFTAEIIFPKQ